MWDLKGKCLSQVELLGTQKHDMEHHCQTSSRLLLSLRLGLKKFQVGVVRCQKKKNPTTPRAKITQLAQTFVIAILLVFI